MTNSEIASRWFSGSIKPVPDGAYAHAQAMCFKYGGCSEVIIDAYTEWLDIQELDSLCECGLENHFDG